MKRYKTTAASPASCWEQPCGGRAVWQQLSSSSLRWHHLSLQQLRVCSGPPHGLSAKQSFCKIKGAPEPREKKCINTFTSVSVFSWSGLHKLKKRWVYGSGIVKAPLLNSNSINRWKRVIKRRQTTGFPEAGSTLHLQQFPGPCSTGNVEGLCPKALCSQLHVSSWARWHFSLYRSCRFTLLNCPLPSSPIFYCS